MTTKTKTKITGSEFLSMIEKSKCGAIPERNSRYSDSADYLIFCEDRVYRSNGRARVIMKNGFNFEGIFFGIPVKWLKANLAKTKRERDNQVFAIDPESGNIYHDKTYTGLEFEIGVAINIDVNKWLGYERNCYFGLGEKDFINLVNTLEPENRYLAIDHVTKYNPESSDRQKKVREEGAIMLLKTAKKMGLLPLDWTVCEDCGNPGKCEKQLFRKWNPWLRSFEVMGKRKTKTVRCHGGYDEDLKMACPGCRKKEQDRQAQGKWNPEKMRYEYEKTEEN